MNHFYSPVLIPIICLSCSTSQPWIVRSDSITDSFISDMRTCGWVVYGTGGAMREDIELVALSFQTICGPDITFARAIFVETMENLLDRYNASEEAKPYLHNFPFTNKNIELSLRFLQPNGDQLPEGLVTYMFNVHGRIVYYSYDPDPSNPNHLKVLLREPYEEALKILDIQSNFPGCA